MITAHKYKLYRSKKNKEIDSLITTAGYIWNHALALQKRYYSLYGSYISSTRMQSHIAKLRKRNPYWMKLNSQSVQEICQRLDAAYKRFFTKKAKRPPKFKKTRLFTSIVFKQAGFKLDGNKLTINAIGKTFKFHFSRNYGKPKRIVVKRNSLGEFYLTIFQESINQTFKTRNGAIGLDFGMKTFLTGTNGYKKESPLFFKQLQNELAKAQRNLSSKKKGSNNRTKARLAVARIHKRIENKRSDFQWKLAHDLCSQYSFIAIEDLNIEGMKRMWGKKISDLSHASFITKLKYIATKYGTIIQEVGRFYPSSKTCSCCGHVKKELKLSERIYVCESCNHTEDRDINASNNILSEGIRLYESVNKTSKANHVCIVESPVL